MVKGKVLWFNDAKGFGFISGNNGTEYFVHFNDIQMEGHKSLIEGQRVEFDVELQKKGWAAKNVRLSSEPA